MCPPAIRRVFYWSNPMADPPASPPPSNLPASFEPKAFYKVEIATVFKHAERQFVPGDNVTMRGEIAEQYRANLLSAVKVEE
jgi:hypothetical protein